MWRLVFLFCSLFIHAQTENHANQVLVLSEESEEGANATEHETEGEEGGEEGEEGEEEEEVSEASAAVAATLLGAVSFQMMLFYLTNHPDADMRKYTYKVLDATISIFCAVLLFSAINGYVELWVKSFGEENEAVFATIINLGEVVVWFTFMQLAVAYLCGIFQSSIQRHEGEGVTMPKTVEAWEALDKKSKMAVKHKLSELEKKCGSYATLLAHITGFASINAFSNMQQLDFFRQSVGHSLLVVPIAWVVLTILQRITDTIRERKIGDIRDLFEDSWDDETEEAENDVMGLTISFLITQTCRFGVTGKLANAEGAEEHGAWEEGELHTHTWMQFLKLGFCAIVAVAIASFSISRNREAEEEQEKKETEMAQLTFEQTQRMETTKRFWETWIVATTMTFAWCLFFGYQWLVAWFIHDEMILGVCLALFSSGFCFVKIYFCDKMSDSLVKEIKKQAKAEKRKRESQVAATQATDKKEEEDEEVELALLPPGDRSRFELQQKIMDTVIDANGILVGFAWERCFDVAVLDLAKEVSQKTKNSAISAESIEGITRVILAVFCAGLIVPAWRWYILPMFTENGWRTGVVIEDENHMHRVKKGFHSWSDSVDHELRERLEELETENNARAGKKDTGAAQTRERKGISTDEYMPLNA